MGAAVSAPVVHTEWNPEQGKALPSRKDNLPHEEAKTAVASLIKSTARNDVVSVPQAIETRHPGRGHCDAADTDIVSPCNGDLPGSRP